MQLVATKKQSNIDHMNIWHLLYPMKHGYKTWDELQETDTIIHTCRYDKSLENGTPANPIENIMLSF